MLNIYRKCKLEQYVLKWPRAWDQADRENNFSNTENDQSTWLLFNCKYKKSSNYLEIIHVGLIEKSYVLELRLSFEQWHVS